MRDDVLKTLNKKEKAYLAAGVAAASYAFTIILAKGIKDAIELREVKL